MSIKVSVLMTAYNREKFIAEAIESVLNQTYNDFELIIVDDCSVDRTLDIARQYEAQDPRIKVYGNKINLGQFGNRNYAADLAQGELFMYVDSDDTIAPDSLGYVVQLFDDYPMAGFSTIYYGNKLEDRNMLAPEESISEHFFGEGILHVGPGGTAIRKALFRRIKGFSGRFGPASDMYYNLVVASSAPILIHKNKYLNYRIHEGQELNNSFAYLYQGYRYLMEALDEKFMPLTDSQERFIRKKNKRRFLVNLLRHLRKTKNLTEVKTAIRLSGFTFRNVMEAVFSFFILMVSYGG